MFNLLESVVYYWLRMSEYIISFHTTWPESDKDFFYSIKRQTPSNTGVWDRIKGTSASSEADYHIVFDRPRKDVNYQNTLMYNAEPPVSPSVKGWSKVNKDQRHPIEVHHKPQRWWVNKSYDQLKQLDPIKKSYDLSWITSDKGRSKYGVRTHFRKLMMNFGVDELRMKNYPIINKPFYGHILRMELYDRLVANTAGILHLYGRGNFNGDHYKGTVEDKWSALKDYRYTLAIENYQGPNYFTEKISDALLAWCMPIYWGCTNLSEYIPENSYVNIDIEDPNAPQQIKSIIESDIREKNIDAIAEARNRILDCHQIWPTVQDSILNL